MKKYIIGLFSAICLMGAGCTEFEDYEPVAMGDGPSVTVALEKTAIDAFNLTVTPGEGAVYYAYVVTTEAMSLDADNLLQAKYEGAELLKVAETASVAKSFTNQKIGTTYYVYAVASNDKGLCGAIASATLELPDEEAPHLVSVPDGYLYTATNNGRSVTLTFNENVVRGEGAITYNVTKGDLTSYANGAIESVVINGESVIITLPETVAFDENEAKSYVFLDFAAGAFADAAGNLSAALKGGVDQETQLVGAPYWEYVPGGGTTGGSVVLELDETGMGSYVVSYVSLFDGEPYNEQLVIAKGSVVNDPESEYVVAGFGYYAYSNTESYGYLPASLVDGVFQLAHGYMVAESQYQNTDYLLAVTGIIYDEASGQVTGLYEPETIPFTASAEDARIMTTDVILAYALCDATTYQIQGFIEGLTNTKILPMSLAEAATVEASFTPSINRMMKAHAVKQYLEANKSQFKLKRLQK